MIKAFLLTGLILVASPDDELYDALSEAPNARAAAKLEADIRADWNESGSATADLMMERAQLALEAGKFEIARAFCDRAILIQPDFAEAYRRRADLFLADDNVVEAIQDLNQTLTLDPRHFEAWTVLGAVFERLGARSEAAEAYKEALAVHPHFQPAKQGAQRTAASGDGVSL